MKKLNWILFGGIAFGCTAEGTNDSGNVFPQVEMKEEMKEFPQVENKEFPQREKPVWGSIGYTTLSHFDITFDSFDLKRTKAANVDGGLKIPMGVTEVLLRLSGSLEFVKFPETVRNINQDIFNGCDVKNVFLEPKTIKCLLGNKTEGDLEESIRKYFNLNEHTEIIIGGHNLTGTYVPMEPKNHGLLKEILRHKEQRKDDSFVKQIQNFDPKNLKHVEKSNDRMESADKPKESENPLFNDIQNFDKRNLKHVEKSNDGKREALEYNKKLWLDEIQNFDKSQLKHREPTEKPKPQDPLAEALLKKVPFHGEKTSDLNADPDWDTDSDWD